MKGNVEHMLNAVNWPKRFMLLYFNPHLLKGFISILQMRKLRLSYVTIAQLTNSGAMILKLPK